MNNELVKVIAVEVGDDNDAWYMCSDGMTYYDCMYTSDIRTGDVINPKNYIRT